MATSPPPANRATSPPPANMANSPPPANMATSPPPANRATSPPPANTANSPPPANMATSPPPANMATSQPPESTGPPENRGKSWFGYFQYDERIDSPKDARNVLLVVAALIAAVTFQAGVNPPGGVWQDDGRGHAAGRAIYGAEGKAFYVFLLSNTLALSTSILVILSLTYRFPLHFEVAVATVSMIVTYGSAIFAVTPKESVKFRYILASAAVPFIVRCLIQIYNRYKPKAKDFEQCKCIPL